MSVDPSDIDALHDIAAVANRLHALAYDLTDWRSFDRMVKHAADAIEVLVMVLALAPDRLPAQHACPACGNGFFRQQTVFPHTANSPVYRMCDYCGHKGELEWPPGQQAPKRRKR